MTDSIAVLMPRLSDSMTEGTIARWLKQDGEEVRRGEAIVEIDTDKATMSFEADAAGTLRLLSATGDTVAVGAPIAAIETAEGGGSGASGRSSPAPAQAQPAQAAPVLAVAPASGAGRSRDGLNASPLARRFAAALNVDLASVRGSGEHSRILKRDVSAAATGSLAPAPPRANGAHAEAPPAPARTSIGASRPFTARERIVSERMTAAATIPTFYVETEVVLTKALALREQLRPSVTPTPSLNDIIVKAVAVALADHPRLNSSFGEDAIVYRAEIDIAIAIAAGDDLFVPSIAGADRLSLPAIAVRSAELVARAREGALSASDLAPGTFTITNLGMLATTRFVPLLNPPQAAILSVGAFRPDHTRGKDGTAAMVAALGLVCDHRVVYGAHAAAFLQSLAELLEAPMRLLL